MPRLLYNLLFPVVFLVLLPGYLVRMYRRGGWRSHFAQRLGIYGADLQARLASEQGRVWIQAVSVGEMFIALKLIAALRRLEPELRFLLSTTTTTGFALAEKSRGAETEVLYTPIDILPCAQRAWRALRPAALLVVEGGLWPNSLALAQRSKRPAALVNARLSPRSERRFRRFRRLAAPLLFQPLALLTAPEPGDIERWKSLGAEPGKIRIVGNIKFDEAEGVLNQERAAAFARLLGDAARHPILLAGSTHPGEELLVAKEFMRARQSFPDLRLLVAPRHFERAGDAIRDITGLGLRVERRTALSPEHPFEGDVLVLDTTGELRDWYGLATLVFIGKTLTPAAAGGQNPVEAILAGRPVLFGPHMENFAEIVSQLLAGDAAIQVREATELGDECARLLADDERRAALARRARELMAAHRGAADRTAVEVLRLLRAAGQT